MSRTSVSIVLIGFLGITGIARAVGEKDEEAEVKRLAKATLDVARDGLKKELPFFRTREIFWWSQRILFAELETCETPAARLQGFQDHVRRCKEFEARIAEMKAKEQIAITDLMDARFFRTRAEYWLAGEKLRQAQIKAGRKDVKPPFPSPPAGLDQ